MTCIFDAVLCQQIGLKVVLPAFVMCNSSGELSLTLVGGMQRSKIMELSKSLGESGGEAEHLRLNTNASACLKRFTYMRFNFREGKKKNLFSGFCILGSFI